MGIMARKVNARRRAQQSRHAVSTITERQVEQMRALDGVTLSDLCATVSEVVSPREVYAADVEAYAMTIAADVFAGTPDVRMAARKAVKIARTRVARAMSLDVSLEAWAESGAGDAALEDAIRDGDRPVSVSPRPDGDPEATAIPSNLDHAVEWVWVLARRGAVSHADARLWSDMVAAYAGHVMADGTCGVCEGRPATRRPTLASCLAHETGQASSSALGKRCARVLATVSAALLAIGVRDDMTRPMRGGVSRVRLGHDQGEYGPGAVAWDVRDAAGESRIMTGPEVWAVLHVNAWDPSPVDWEAFRADPRHDVGDRVNLNGQVAAGARPARRKGKSGSGQTGPTVPERFPTR